ncbi:MAG: hypothetical protein RL491_1234 [Bacteroidota bacterium]
MVMVQNLNPVINSFIHLATPMKLESRRYSNQEAIAPAVTQKTMSHPGASVIISSSKTGVIYANITSCSHPILQFNLVHLTHVSQGQGYT